MPGPAASPEAIVGAATGFMAAKQLFAASRLGLFGALAGGPLSSAALAARLGVPERSARILADAMVGLGLLVREDGGYRDGDAALAYLSGQDGSLDLRPFLAFWDEISYPHWLAYEQAVRKAEPAPLDLGESRQATFFAGVGALNSAHALVLAEHYDFGAHSRVLDLGGLSAAFLTGALDRHPGLRGTFIVAEPMADAARAAVEASGHSDRIRLVAGDPLTCEIPGGHDAVLLEHVVHRFDAPANRALLARARGAVAEGARLLVLDFLLDEATSRPLDALMAGEYLVVDGTVVYPEAEVRAWLEATGWHWRETLQLPGAPRVLIADAV